MRAWRLRSGGIASPLRCGSSRSPKSTTIAIVPATSGMPTSANSKNPNVSTPAFFAEAFTITLTGVPVSVSIDPACAPNASGSSSCEVGRPSRIASMTTIGISAATEPLTLISAVSAATSSIVSTISRVRLSPAGVDQALTGPDGHAGRVEGALTTNSDAMKMTV